MKVIELKFLICHAARYSSQGIVYNMLPKEEHCKAIQTAKSSIWLNHLIGLYM